MKPPHATPADYPPDAPAYDMDAAADHLGITPNTLRAYRFKRYPAGTPGAFPEPALRVGKGTVPLWSREQLDAWRNARTPTTTIPEPPPRDGVDQFDRAWRIAPSGIEHAERDPGHLPSSIVLAARMVKEGASSTFSWCGRDITALPPSPDRGERRPCARCLVGENAADA